MAEHAGHLHGPISGKKLWISLLVILAFVLEQCAAIVGAVNKTLHDNFGIEHATIQTEIEGLCDMTEVKDLYCGMLGHAHKEGHRH